MQKLIATALFASAFGFAVGAGVSNYYRPDAKAHEDHGFVRGLVSAMVMAHDHRLATDADTINKLVLHARLSSDEIYERPAKLLSMGVVTRDMVTNK